MPSVIEGYNYDIFISYRLKDNVSPDRESIGWVSEFVARLRKELQSTLKEEISVYFDENPYDGILATHDVNDSIKGKLKCLILIPIISQTYCDTKCFAWQHEFLAFKTLASVDPFGLKIKLHNGNVAARILPVCIHDLEPADRALVENEVGPLRAVDFIFRSPGVNRPLAPSDKREDGATKILYKDQVNKVANAVKDLIKGMEEPNPKIISGLSNHTIGTDSRSSKKKLIAGGIILALITLAAYAVYNRLTTVKPMDKSIAVLPFVDMSADQDLEYLGDGIAEEIINSLTAIRDLRIIGRTSSFQFKGEKLDLREVGKKLNVANILEGSVQRSGSKMRITAQLIRTEDNSHIWSKRYDIEQTEIFKLQDNIASNIVETLNLTLSSSEKNRLIKKETSEEAYMIYLKGLFQYKRENFKDAFDLFQAVVAKDSLYAPAHAYLGLSKAWLVIRSRDIDNVTRTADAIGSAEKAIELDPMLPEGYSGRALIAWAIQHDFVKARTYFEKSLELDPGSSLIRNRYCYFLIWMGDFEKSIKLSKEAMRIDPVDYNSYMILYTVTLYSNRLQEARSYHNELIKITGNSHSAVSRNIELNFYEKNFEKVNQLCDSINNAGGTIDASDLSYNSMAYLALNKRNESDKLLHDLTQVQGTWNVNAYYYAARAFAFRNQADSCFAYLTKAVNKREGRLNHFKVDPAFKELRNDPRYIQIFNDLGFDRY